MLFWGSDYYLNNNLHFLVGQKVKEDYFLRKIGVASKKILANITNINYEIFYFFEKVNF